MVADWIQPFDHLAAIRAVQVSVADHEVAGLGQQVAKHNPRRGMATVLAMVNLITLVILGNLIVMATVVPMIAMAVMLAMIGMLTLAILGKLVCMVAMP